MTSDLTLYHYWRSSCSWRVRWSLEYKGIPYRAVPVNLLQGEHDASAYLQKNPFGTVPCLVTSDGRPMGESLAILEWLEETHPEKPLLPTDPWQRAWVRAFALGIVAGIQPLQNLRTIRFYSEQDAERKKWARHWISRGLQASETMLEAKSGTHCLGDQLTLADLCLIPQIYNAERFEVPMDPFPLCRRLYETGRKLESCIAAAPERWQST